MMHHLITRAVQVAAVAVAGLAAVAVTGTAAHGATGDRAAAEVTTTSTCDAVRVEIDPGATRRTWTVAATVDGADWVWPAGDLAPDGTAPDNGWVNGDPAVVQVPRGATGVTVAWWHSQDDPDLAGEHWQQQVTETDWVHPGGLECGEPNVQVEDDRCSSVTLVFDNPTEFYFSGDYRVDGEAGTPDQWSDMDVGQGPHAGELFGDRYVEVDLPPGKSATIDLSFGAGTGEHLIEWVIRRGAEQQWYVPWGELTVDCGQPNPSPSPSPSTPASPAPGAGGELASTGVDTRTIAGGGVGLVALGALAVLLSKIRRRPADR